MLRRLSSVGAVVFQAGLGRLANAQFGSSKTATRIAQDATGRVQEGHGITMRNIICWEEVAGSALRTGNSMREASHRQILEIGRTKVGLYFTKNETNSAIDPSTIIPLDSTYVKARSGNA